MTISEQLRDAALYLKVPGWHMSGAAVQAALAYDDPAATLWRCTQGRTFLLLVAEALE